MIHIALICMSHNFNKMHSYKKGDTEKERSLFSVLNKFFPIPKNLTVHYSKTQRKSNHSCGLKQYKF